MAKATIPTDDWTIYIEPETIEEAANLGFYWGKDGDNGDRIRFEVPDTAKPFFVFNMKSMLDERPSDAAE